MVFGSIFQSTRDFFAGAVNWPFKTIRTIGTFISGILSCPMCFSTWGGFFLGYVIYSPTHHLFDLHYGVSWFFDGILSSGAVWVINDFAEYLESKSSK